jgi:hypothetical protein
MAVAMALFETNKTQIEGRRWSAKIECRWPEAIGAMESTQAN